jgi:hypothetical protein
MFVFMILLRIYPRFYGFTVNNFNPSKNHEVFLNQRAMWQKYHVVSNCMVLKTRTKTMHTKEDFEAPLSPPQRLG